MSLTFDPEKHEYRLDGRILPHLTGILESVGLIDKTFYTEEGRIRGQYVHLACHYYDIGLLDEEELDPALVPYVDGWKLFVADSDVQIIESEVPSYHPEYLYACTPDKRALLRGKEATIEIKSGKLMPWTAIQTAAQSLIQGTRKRYGVELPGDGRYRLVEYKDRQDVNIWLSCLAIHNWKSNNGRK